MTFLNIKRAEIGAIVQWIEHIHALHVANPRLPGTTYGSQAPPEVIPKHRVIESQTAGFGSKTTTKFREGSD